ncbi:hypothetical protein N8Z35_02130 [Pelagibacteraceae bacterium]|nr:hypothetical protein [Candidatus Pelagibacter bacterium]MDC1253722.1 hypothetical protein [Pelagibacteraceae bacterium]
MKKLLGIIVLSLLLSGNAYAKDEYLEDLIPIGSSKQHLCSILDGNKKSAFKGVYGNKRSGTMLIPINGNGRFICHGFNSKYWNYSSQHKTEIIANGLDKVFFVYGNVTAPMSCTKFYCWKPEKRGTGKLIKIAYSQEEAYAHADPTLTASFIKRDKKKPKKKLAVTQSSSSQSSSSQSLTLSTDDKITQSKQICRDLGFKTNTEKFADCALKMMSIQFEATNKVAASSGGTKQEIIVKHKQDYDIFDAMLDMSNALLSNGNNSSSSSSNNNTRCVIGKTNPMFGTTTMNCN